MQPHITMWAYIWDLVDDGIDDVLRQMRDEIGLTALSLATHYHTVEHLRPHTKGPFIHRSDSALYFQPDWSRYRGSIRHQVAPVAMQGNPLKRIAERASEMGLEVVSWTLCCHSSHLGRTHPRCTMVNACGDHYPEALCPANPDVRGFLTGLADDLTHHYHISMLELESCEYAPSRHYHHHEKVAIPLGVMEHFLLGLCFCEHCSERGRTAGGDMEGLRRRVAQRIRATFAAGDPAPSTQASVDDWVAQDRDLAALVRARVEAVTTLVGKIKAASKAPVSPIVWAGAAAAGTDMRALADLCGSVTIAAYASQAAQVRAAIESATKQAGGVERLRVGYHAFAPITPDRDTLLRNIEASLDLGVRAFSFYNYGIAPQRSLDWVRAAAALIRKRCGG